MVKFIGTIIALILFVILTGFNLDNKCNFWFFHTFKDIPVFIAILTSFICGIIVSLPFTMNHMNKKNKKIEKNSKAKKEAKKEEESDDEEDVVVGDDE